jgi:hypothetical protein
MSRLIPTRKKKWRQDINVDLEHKCSQHDQQCCVEKGFEMGQNCDIFKTECFSP